MGGLRGGKGRDGKRGETWGSTVVFQVKKVL